MLAFADDPTAATTTAIVAASATILVALISGLVSLLGLIISKEQKISDFRQAWIDALRQDTATLLANANTICASLLVSPMSPDKWATLKENVFALNELSAKIKLRLNRREKEHDAVQKTLEAHDAEFTIPPGTKPPDPAKVVEIEKRLVAETQ
jgi:translation initiation factor 2 beta subunit (eIF-2beta)/eIF-5